jgi:hypothetical protein
MQAETASVIATYFFNLFSLLTVTFTHSTGGAEVHVPRKKIQFERCVERVLLPSVSGRFYLLCHGKRGGGYIKRSVLSGGSGRWRTTRGVQCL